TLLLITVHQKTPSRAHYTLSLHDALPISEKHLGADRQRRRFGSGHRNAEDAGLGRWGTRRRRGKPARRQVHQRPSLAARSVDTRSEEHTSELQSRENLVCRLLLEKKKRLK